MTTNRFYKKAISNSSNHHSPMFNDLPKDIIREILSWLDMRDLAALAQSQKWLNQFIQSETVSLTRDIANPVTNTFKASTKRVNFSGNYNTLRLFFNERADAIKKIDILSKEMNTLLSRSQENNEIRKHIRNHSIYIGLTLLFGTTFMALEKMSDVKELSPSTLIILGLAINFMLVGTLCSLKHLLTDNGNSISQRYNQNRIYNLSKINIEVNKARLVPKGIKAIEAPNGSEIEFLINEHKVIGG